MICTLDLQYSNTNNNYDHSPISVPLTPVFIILLLHVIILYFICLLRHSFLFLQRIFISVFPHLPIYLGASKRLKAFYERVTHFKVC